MVNNVGGSVFAEDIRLLAFQGRLATVGYLDRVMKAEFDIDALHAKRLKLFGVYEQAPQRREPRGHGAGLHRGLPAILRRRAHRPLIDRVYRFDELLARPEGLVESVATSARWSCG